MLCFAHTAARKLARNTFLSLLQIGDLLHATVTVSKCSGRRTTFATSCLHEPTGRVVVDGTALALMPSHD